jgi:putative phage-type endonuclease
MIDVVEYDTHEEWEKDRAKGIGGSDIAALMGLSPYKTPLQLYLDKIGEGEEFIETQKTKMGHIMEPVILDLFREATGLNVRSFDKTSFINKEFPYFRASLDGDVVDANMNRTAIVEVKNVGGYGTSLWEDGVPSYYYTQAQFYAGILGVPKIYVGALFDGYDFKFYSYDYDPQLFLEMWTKGKTFWENNVQKRIPPEPITEEDVKLLYPKPEAGKTIEADSIAVMRLNELMVLKDQIADLDEKRKALETELKAQIADNEVMTWRGKSLISYKKNKDTVGFDYKKYVEENVTLTDELKEKYKKVKFGPRIFRPNRKNLAD